MRGLGRRARGHRERRGCERVAIDHQIHGRRPLLPGQLVEGEILQPHARMNDFRLMSGEKNRRGGIGRRNASCRDSWRPTMRGVEQLAARQLCNFGQRSPLQIIRPLTAEVQVPRNHVGHVVERRLGEDGAIFSRHVQSAMINHAGVVASGSWLVASARRRVLSP